MVVFGNQDSSQDSRRCSMRRLYRNALPCTRRQPRTDLAVTEHLDLRPLWELVTPAQEDRPRVTFVLVGLNAAVGADRVDGGENASRRQGAALSSHDYHTVPPLG